MIASVFPEELTALRAGGLVFAVLLIVFAVWRRRSLSNAAVLLAILGGIGLAIVSGTELLDALLSAFSFERGNGGRILGLAVFAIAILFLLVLRALTESARMNQQLSALLEGLAWEEFRQAKLPERFRDKIAVVIPAFNEAESVGDVVRSIPPEVCGEPTVVLVVDDGSRDDTSEEAAKAGAVVARHVINRGGGAALRTGYRLMAESGALVVVTLDADGQHLPEEIPHLLEAARDGAHLVLGTRDHLFAEMVAARRLANRLSSWAISWAAGQPLSDVQTGFRLYTRQLVEATGFPETRFDAESAVVVRASRRGFRIVTVPVRLGFADGRTTSHYRPLVDSLRIARSVMRARLEAGAATAAGELGGLP